MFSSIHDKFRPMSLLYKDAGSIENDLWGTGVEQLSNTTMVKSLYLLITKRKQYKNFFLIQFSAGVLHSEMLFWCIPIFNYVYLRKKWERGFYIAFVQVLTIKVKKVHYLIKYLFNRSNIYEVDGSAGYLCIIHNSTVSFFFFLNVMLRIHSTTSHIYNILVLNIIE